MNIARALSDHLILLVSIVCLAQFITTSQLANHVVEDEQWLLLLYYHLASSFISSPQEVAPLSSREMSVSRSLLDSE